MFISPKIPYIDYRGDVIYNNPINLSMCTHIEKSRLRWYPDSIGKPSITFYFLDGSSVQWCYDSESDRDIDFAGISTNNYKGA